MIVADTNTILYFYLPNNDYSDSVIQLKAYDPVWAAPLLWRSEMRNVLAKYMGRGLMDAAKATALQQSAELLMKGEEYQVESSSVLALANKTGCTAYDCEFVSLAMELGTKLITYDKKLLAAFPDIAVTASQYQAC